MYRHLFLTSLLVLATLLPACGPASSGSETAMVALASAAATAIATTVPATSHLTISPTWPQDKTLLAAWGRKQPEGDCYVFYQFGSQLYLSGDGGSTWPPLWNGLPPGCSYITALAISPNYAQDGTIFAGLVGNGLFKSTDGGQLWQPASDGLLFIGTADGRVLSLEAEAVALPVIVHAYPNGSLVPAEERYSVAQVTYASRLAMELGVDIVKTFYTGSAELFAQVVEAAAPALVVAAGRPRLDNELACFRMAYDTVRSVAAGITFGGNIWQSAQPRRMVEVLKQIVHSDVTPEAALEMWHNGGDSTSLGGHHG
ncbi:MAG: hypothetical protein ACUVWR_12240 [Anaerolineae bacterium]